MTRLELRDKLHEIFPEYPAISAKITEAVKIVEDYTKDKIHDLTNNKFRSDNEVKK
jgi:hypothetical protein